ncbi:hypothetical protein, partial [Streptomyces zaomyceticus]|uniref:hypothetical protein n=1 Tax=Streptomyces zaomyceticus TaxID=68286 RepID=UPI003695CB7A
MPGGGPVAAGRLADVVRLAGRAGRAGRGGDLDALRAFYLQYRHGVLAGVACVQTPRGPVVVANLSGEVLPPTDFSRVGVAGRSGRLEEGSGTPAPWAGETILPVFLADVVGDRARIVDPAGGEHLVSFPVLGQLLVHAAGRVPGSLPVVVSLGASSPLRLARPDLVQQVAWATGALSWAASRPAGPAAGSGGFAVLGPRRPVSQGLAVGRWLPGRPDDLAPGGAAPVGGGSWQVTTVTGHTITPDALMTYTLTTGGGTRVAGFDSFSDPDLAVRESEGIYSADAAVRYRITRATTSAAVGGVLSHTPPVALPTGDRDYYAGGHASADGLFRVWSQTADPVTGTPKTQGHTVHGGQYATLIKNDPAFTRSITQGGRVHLRHCGLPEQQLIRTQDPLVHDRPTQHVANTLRTRTYRSTTDIAFLGPQTPATPGPMLENPTPEGHPPPQYEEIWPLPTRDELDRLYALSGFNPTHTNRRHLRPYVRAWTRAIRHDPHLGTPAEGPPDWTHTTQLRTNPHYHALIKGFGALENMRHNDPTLTHRDRRPLTTPLLNTILT